MKNNLAGLTLTEAIEGLKKRQFSSFELVTDCYERIEKHDVKIKAFLILCKETALEQAKKADILISKEGKTAEQVNQLFIKFPLLGIPYACKDNFNTYGIETTASSAILKGYIPPYESTVTKKLAQAGAILLGKTNMDAFAHGSSTETSDFFTTVNPYDTSRVAGGSSGGSAAALASDMCIFAIGSETSGSIRGPSAWCGVTGVKPTYGRVSRYGVIAMASSTDSPGPIGKTIEDCAYVLSIIAGKDPLDATSSQKEVPNYFTKLKGVSLKEVKIGKPKSYFGIQMEKGVRESIETALSDFKQAGAEIIDIDLLDPKYGIAVYTILQRSEVSSNLARFDGIRYGQPRTAFGFEAKKRMMLGAYTLSSGYYDEYYTKAQRVRTLILEDFVKAFSKVNFIVGPTMPTVALKVGESANNAMFGEMSDVLINASSIAGLSAVSFPSVQSSGLPVGLQLIGKMFDEEKLLATVYAFQQITGYHKERAHGF